jgi:hypothetical protein
MQVSNVAIGKSNPSYTLDVYDRVQVSSSGTPALNVLHTNSNFAQIASFLAPNLMSNITASYAGITLQKDTGNNNGWLLAHVHQGELTSSNYLGFSPNGSGYVMAITAASNVGINTTTPQYQLDVNGLCRVNTNAPIMPNMPFIRGCFNPNNAAASYITLLSFYAQGGMTVTSSTRLVAPISGLYNVGFQTIMNTTTAGRADIYMMLNGSTYIQDTLNEDNGTGYHYRNASLAIYLNANDYLAFYLNLNSIYGGAAAGTYESARTFWFYLVG